MKPIETYGDLPATMLDARKKEEIAKAVAAQEEYENKRQERLAALRPLLTVMRQVMERYPEACISNLDCHGGIGPRFYTCDNDVVIVHVTEAGVFEITIDPQSRNRKTLVSSEHPEDLIPKLMELLVDRVRSRI